MRTRLICEAALLWRLVSFVDAVHERTDLWGWNENFLASLIAR